LDYLFIGRLLLSFVIAGTWVSLTSLLAEKLGSKIGGLIASLPSVIVITLIFIGLDRGRSFAAQTAAAVPIGMLVNTGFLLVFIATARFGAFRAAGLSLCTWLGLTLLFNLLPPFGLGLGSLLYSTGTLLAFLVAEYPLRVRSVPKQSLRFSWLTFTLRAFFSGSVVAAAVALSRVAPPYLTGIIAAFPAVMLSTMTILTKVRGAAFAAATGKIMLISMSSIIVYAALTAFLFGPLGLALGSLIGYAGAAVWLFVFRLVLRRVH